VKRSAAFCRDTGIMDLAIMVNPYYHFDFEMPEKELGEIFKKAMNDNL
jgi:hypothetical protein